jgi:hypothetical protein
MDKAYTHLRMLTPDGMRPKGVYLNLAHHIAHVFRVQYGRGKIKSEYGAILRDILEAPEK